MLAAWPEGLHLGSERLRGQARDRWRGAAGVLALRLREVKNRPVLEVDRDDVVKPRVGWLAALGIDVMRLARQLNAGERVRVTIPADVLPLPLPGLWPALLEREGAPDIVRLGASHRPALLYAGLMSLDSETLAYFAANPKVLDLDTHEAGVFAAFGRSIHVRGGRLELPGGGAYVPIWTHLVDRRPEQPVDFMTIVAMNGSRGLTEGPYRTVPSGFAADSPPITAQMTGPTAQKTRVDDRHGPCGRWSGTPPAAAATDPRPSRM